MKAGVATGAVRIKWANGAMVSGIQVTLFGVGPGIAGSTSWIVTALVMVLLAVLAWWAMRSERRATRATRANVRRGRQQLAARMTRDASGVVVATTSDSGALEVHEEDGRFK